MKRDLFALFVLMLTLFLLANGGRIEGQIYPVTTRGTILRTEPVDASRTRFWGYAHRIRECTFVRLEWSFGPGLQIALVDLYFEEGKKTRGQGHFDYGPWIIQLSPEQLLTGSRAVVYHRCHPFWLTETIFYSAG